MKNAVTSNPSNQEPLFGLDARVEVLGTGLEGKVRGIGNDGLYFIMLDREPSAYERKLVKVHPRQLRAAA